jgi:hypothetical protein
MVNRLRPASVMLRRLARKLRAQLLGALKVTDSSPQLDEPSGLEVPPFGRLVEHRLGPGLLLERGGPVHQAAAVEHRGAAERLDGVVDVVAAAVSNWVPIRIRSLNRAKVLLSEGFLVGQRPAAEDRVVRHGHFVRGDDAVAVGVGEAR